MVRGKTTYLIGSLIICIVAILAVAIGLTAGGVVDLFSTSVTFRTGSATYEYDGMPKTLDQWSISKGALKKGHTAKVTMTGSQTDVGSSGNTISVQIYDENGEDVTNLYSISYDIGELKVTKRVLEIESLEAEKEYDGQPLTADGYIITNGTLAPKQTVEAIVTGSITDIGQADNTFAVSIMQGDTDVSKNYDLKLIPGKLSVTKRRVFVKTADAQKVFDGKTLFDHSWEITQGSLLEGDSLDVAVKGEQTAIGVVDNVADVTLNASGENGSDIYEIIVEYGKLKVAHAEILVKTGSKSKIFDNTPLVCEQYEYEIIEGDLKPGHTLSVKFSNLAVDAGTYDNEAQFFVHDDAGEDITDLYIFDTEFGTLEISPLKVVLSSGDKEKVYDATPLEGDPDTCTIVDGGLLEGHTVTFRMTGSQTNVGESENRFVAIIFDESGNNITSSYVVEYNPGKLKVTPASLLVKSGSASKNYDGLPLTCKEAQAEALPTGGGLQGRDYLDISSMMFVNSQTDAGSIDNEIAQIIIRNEQGQIVTGNYDITVAWGKLTVFKTKIQVRAASKTKADDGTPLTDSGFTVEPKDALVGGHVVRATIEGEQDGVGTSDNVVVSVSIVDEAGNDKTNNYDIETKDGTLSVTGERPQAPGLDKGGSTSGSGEQSEEDLKKLCLKIKSDKDGKVYLRLKSFGSYEGGWKDAQEYGSTLNGDYGYAYLTGTLLDESGFISSKLDIENYTSDYLLPYYLSMQESASKVQSGDLLFDGDTSTTYSALFYAFDYVSGKSKLATRTTYVSEESNYYGYASSVYLIVPDSTREYMQGIIADNGFDKNDADVIEKVASFIQLSAKYTAKYDRSLDSQEDVAVAFLRDYKEGVCRHYATAATMLFRALGFPARYTIGYAANAKADKWTSVTAKEAHAWTEVYIQGVGWVAVEVTGGASAGGSGSGEKDDSGSGSGSGSGGGSKSFTVSPSLLAKEYGNEAIYLDASEIKTVNGLSVLEKDGYTYDVVCSGKLSAPGKGKSKIERITIYSPEGEDVTENYDLTFAEGELQLYLYKLTITTEGAEKFYDGIALSNENYTIQGLEMGHTANVEMELSQKDVGMIVNTPSIEIVDGSGEDQTDYYKIDKQCGKLVVKARKLVLTTADASKSYDGTALICEEYELNDRDDENGEGLADGDEIAAIEFTGSQTKKGKSDNTASVLKIVDKDGNDVTLNYTITTKFGTLRVTR